MNIVQKIVQNYISRQSPEDLKKITSKVDTLSGPYDQRNNHILGGEDVPTLSSHYVHRHYLIVKGIVHYTKVSHRIKMFTRHPWFKGYMEKVGKALWSQPPTFCRPVDDAKKDPEEDLIIKQAWEENRLQEACKKMWEKSQWGGYAFFYPMKGQFFEGYSGPQWTVYSVDEMGEPADYKQGHPIKWSINHTNKEKTEPKEITITQGIYYDYKNTDDFTGEPFGMGIWDLAIDWLWIQDAVNAFDQRMGNGFFTLVVPNNTDPAQIAKYEQVIRNTRTEMGIVVRGSVEEPVQMNWVGMSGVQVDFIAHLGKLEDLIAFNMGFPKRWIMGDQEGARENGSNDALQVNIQLKNLYTEWMLLIKKILKRYNLISDFNEILIKPPFEMQLSEQEQIELESIKAETLAVKTWLTDNEKREAEGLDPIEGGDELASVQEQKMMEAANTQTPNDKKDQGKTPSNPKSKSDSFDTLIDIFTGNSISVRKLADLCGVSPTTISKMRDKLDAMNKPKMKYDEITMKCDAVALGDDIYEIEDVPVILPQVKNYEHLGYKAERPREEIEKFFKDEKFPKEYRIGVTVTDDHSTGIPLEIPNENTVGTVKLSRLDEEGNIRANIKYSLRDADRILGSDNFIRQHTTNNQNIPTSVALRSRDRPLKNGHYIESDLDIRSFVFTQKNARNSKAGK